jgi:hypothetical protein
MSLSLVYGGRSSIIFPPMVYPVLGFHPKLRRAQTPREPMHPVYKRVRRENYEAIAEFQKCST